MSEGCIRAHWSGRIMSMILRSKRASTCAGRREAAGRRSAPRNQSGQRGYQPSTGRGRAKRGTELLVTRLPHFLQHTVSIKGGLRWLDREFLQLYVGIWGDFYVTAAPRSAERSEARRGARWRTTILQKCGRRRERGRESGERARAPLERPISNKSNGATERDQRPSARLVASNEAPFIKGLV